ncbi:MAG: 4a-hydroxytetrahydrobiopterin dehydratase [Hyphomicrobiales bacterium]|nr:4a-hydroxytetrahydrobiopterin dehydratase [Hyphomicrobiales bacterium]PCH50350.1 MAG: 4a-hydroxytetrahydrobiopterin dehydratase [Hyphomicrobiales bacterium]
MKNEKLKDPTLKNPLLNNTDRDLALKSLNGWTKSEGRNAIGKEFIFADFKEAFAFMTRVALKAEQMNHHPEWSNVYKTVLVALTTHDRKGVTKLDIELANYMNEIST